MCARAFGGCAAAWNLVESLPQEQEELLSRVALEAARRRTDGELLDHKDVVARIEGHINRK